MHPPPFRPEHRLSDWPDCSLELHCCNCCKGVTVYPVRLLAKQHGNRTFGQLLSQLRCKDCGGKPAPVYLCAGHRQHNFGAPPDWAIELTPAPKP
jgi:hypothetical protein